MDGWRILDYFNSAGVNVIRRWMQSLPVGARIQIDAFILNLQALPQLGMPYTKALKGECNGLIELRILHGNIQYRPLGCYGPGRGEITLLCGAVEQGGKLKPKGACKTALERKQNIHEIGRTDEHSFKDP